MGFKVEGLIAPHQGLGFGVFGLRVARCAPFHSAWSSQAKRAPFSMICLRTPKEETNNIPYINLNKENHFFRSS